MRLLLATVLSLAVPLAAQGNTNERAPTATNKLEFDGGAAVSVSYRSLTLAGGQSLKRLMTKGKEGDRIREFYNTQYLPNFLHGKLEVGADVELGGQTLAKGSYGMTFRIDSDVVWHLVLTNAAGAEVCAVALDTSEDASSKAKRLVIQPVAADEDGSGQLQLQFGSLVAQVPFKIVKKAAPAAGKGGDSTGK